MSASRGVFHLATVVSHREHKRTCTNEHFFGPMDFDIRRTGIGRLSERIELNDQVVTAPLPSRVNLVTDHQAAACFRIESLWDLCFPRHEVHQRTERDLCCVAMLAMPFHVRAVTSNELDVPCKGIVGTRKLPPMLDQT